MTTIVNPKIILGKISDKSLSDIRDEFGDEVATLIGGASEPEELINADRDIIRDYDRLGDGVWDIFNASKDAVA